MMGQEGEVSRWWERDSLEVLWFSGMEHAMVFDTTERRKPILDVAHRFA